MYQHVIGKAMVGGLLGTLLQTLLVYSIVPLMAGRSIDIAGILGHTCDVGMLAHVFSGSVLFPLGYVYLASQGFPGSPVLKGMLWAGLLWVVAEGIMAPLLGAGVFSAELGGLPAAVHALLGYLVYGATLGGIVGAVEPGVGVHHARWRPARSRQLEYALCSRTGSRAATLMTRTPERHG